MVLGRAAREERGEEDRRADRKPVPFHRKVIGVTVRFAALGAWLAALQLSEPWHLALLLLLVGLVLTPVTLNWYWARR